MAHDLCEVHGLHPEALERVQGEMPDGQTMLRLCDIFKALADPTRARILFALSREELCVCDLASLTGLSSSAISHQLRLLRANRLVRFRREAKMAFYSLDDEHVRLLLDQGLCHARE
ncbi:MAG: metalloregulator ArsR/SmtB family transcription factor [Proteobacteria bacterium]|nr:metalloregulator ArsR/SmtB family transcription factor [Pseudomonadota bacterium]